MIALTLASFMLMGDPVLAASGAEEGLITSDLSEIPYKQSGESASTVIGALPSEELSTMTDPVILDADPASEASIQTAASSLTVEAGQTASLDLTAAGAQGSYQFEVSGTNDTSAAGFAETRSGESQTLTIEGQTAGTNLCTINMRDTATGKIAASKTITVKTLPGDSKGANANARLTASKTKIYLAEGATGTLYFRVRNYDPGKGFSLVFNKDTGSYARTNFLGWGTGEDATRMTMSVKALASGTTAMDVSIKDSETGTLVHTIRVTIVVVPRDSVITSVSSATITRTKYKDVTVNIIGKTSGATFTAVAANTKRVKIALLNKTATSATLRIRGLQKGTTSVTVSVKKDGVVLGKSSVNVTVKDLGVIDYAYRFRNNASDFGIADSSTYQYPYSVFSRMFGDNAMARRLWEDYGYGWAGDCYGMTTTAGLIYNQNLADSFKSGKIRGYDLSLSSKSRYSGMSIKTFIQSMMQAQYASVEQNRMNARRDDSTGTNNKIVALAKKGTLVGIGLWGSGWGHEVLGYKAVVSGNTAKVYYYDPNYSNTPQYITFYKSGSNYTRFVFSNTSYSDVWALDYTTYSEYAALWSNRGKLVSYSANYLSAASADFDVFSSSGKLIASVRGGKLTRSSDGVTLVAAKTSSASGKTGLYLPTGIYTVRNKDTSGKSFEVSFSNVNHSAAVRTGASEITFKVNDTTGTNTVSIKGAKNVAYAIRLESTAAGEQGTHTFAGTGSSSVIVAGTSGGTVTPATNARTSN